MGRIAIVIVVIAAFFLGAVSFWWAQSLWRGYEAGDDLLPAPSPPNPAGSLPLQTLVARLNLPPDSRLLEVELEREDGRLLYEIEVLLPGGRVREYYVDPRSGEVVHEEGEAAHLEENHP